MQATVDPGEVGSESLPADLAGELKRYRHAFNEIVGKSHWYQTPVTNLETLQTVVSGKITAADVQNASMLYFVDSGSANAYVVTPTPAWTEYTAGKIIMVKFSNANTGASTINISGLGIKNIKKNYNSDLEASDIRQNQAFWLVYDGTNFQLLGEVNNSIFGTGVDGAISNLTDADTNATTIAQTGTLSITNNRIFKATGNINISQAITVGNQNGQARGSFPTTHGSPGIPLGAILSALGSKGIPAPIRPGGGNTSLCGGIAQFLSGGTIAVNATITADGTNASSDGGGGGGLVVLISKTEISGNGNISVAGANGHSTAAAKAGAGSYSGAPGGHAGIGGSGGGGAGGGLFGGYSGGQAGNGIIPGNAGGNAAYCGGAGGGSLDNSGVAGSGNYNGGNGGIGNYYLTNYSAPFTLLLPGPVRAAVATSNNGVNSSMGNGGNGGTNGGGGGGGGGTSGGPAAASGGNASNLTGSGGGGAGGSNGATDGSGGSGGTGSPDLYVLSDDNNIYAGLPGGQGGGGGGGSCLGGGAVVGTGGSGAIAPSLTKCGVPAGTGCGLGGPGGNGAAGTAAGGKGGDGGNGGGAAGLVLMISPSITYTGTITGRLIKIEGAEALNFIRGNNL